MNIHTTRTKIQDCKIVELPKIVDQRGSLSVVENMRHVPFEIKRIFYLYDISSKDGRGEHAHKTLHQFLICMSGSFDVVLDDGEDKKIIHLDKPWQGLHIPPLIWASEINFAPGSVCLVLTSDFYDESDYYRNYDEFLRALNLTSASIK